jgi:hypothetical protein
MKFLSGISENFPTVFRHNLKVSPLSEVTSRQTSARRKTEALSSENLEAFMLEVQMEVSRRKAKVDLTELQVCSISPIEPTDLRIANGFYGPLHAFTHSDIRTH